jgi:nucleoside 2-deoxyribosyltransferase
VIYLASPYSHPDPRVREQRFEQVCFAAGQLMQKGTFVFAPIVHCHPIAVRSELPKDFAFWEQYDRGMMDACDSLIVLMLDGWRDSAGVLSEIEYMTKCQKPISFMEWK